MLFLALFFLVCLEAFSAETASETKASADLLYQEYTDYVRRFSAEDQYAVNLFARFKRLARKSELLEILETSDLPVDPDQEIGFDCTKQGEFRAALEKPGFVTDYRLGWINLKYYNPVAASVFFQLSINKAEAAGQITPMMLLSLAYSRFLVSESESGVAKKALLDLAEKDIEQSRAIDDKSNAQLASALADRIKAAVELSSLDQEAQ